MRFAGIDVHPDLVSAHAENQVVFFAGAGVSVPRPTRLPDFGELCRRVATLTGSAPPNEADLKAPDVYLGRLHLDEVVDVHQLIEREIRAGRYRNSLHDALTALAAASGHPRIVTTNYDNHLHSALKAHGVKHTVFEAPALPAGDDFEGLVHLHGRLGQPASRLVVTDSDFGKAYITRGWAPDFLRDVFAKFVVCFVGYSHDDRMMDYLARGLPSDARPRYILTDRDEADRWERLRITPILYPDQEHGVVPAVLQAWATWATDTPFDRARRIRSLASDTPPAAPDDHDFLVASLDDARLAPEVCAIARSADWVGWMIQRTQFRSLIGAVDASTPFAVRSALAEWVAEVGVGAENFLQLRRAVADGDGRVDATIAASVLRRITFDEIDPAQRSSWLRWILLRPDGEADITGGLELLWASEVTLSWSDTMLLLDHLANTWRARRVASFGAGETVDLGLDWGFREGVHRVLEGLGSGETRDVLNWVTVYFEQAHRRIASREGQFDSWSFSRSSIAPHTQDRLSSVRGAEHVLIDLARDLLVGARTDAPEVAASCRESWLSSRAPLLQRIALHDLSASTTFDGAQKLAVLLDRSLLFDKGLHHEVYELLASVVAELRSTEYDSLVQAIASGPGGDEDRELAARWRDRRVYDLLHWVLAHRPDGEHPSELAAIESRHPEWQYDEEAAGFRRFTTSGSSSIEDEWPWQPEEFHDMVCRNPRTALEQVDEHPDREELRGWWGAGNMLARTVAQWPDDGFALWELSSTKIRVCIIEGWAGAAMTEDQLGRVVVCLQSAELRGLDAALARMLRPWSSDTALTERWVGRADGRELARHVHAALEDTDIVERPDDLYTQAINSTPGTLAEYWIGAAVHDARAGTYPGGGLSPEVASALEALLEPPGYRRLVRAALLRQLNFFLRADAGWTREHLLVEIDPSRRSWPDIEALWAVVVTGQFSEDLLDAGVRDWIPLIAASADAGSAVSRDLARVSAAVAVHSTMDDSARLDWVTRYVAKAHAADAMQWSQEVAQAVADLDPGARSSLWHRWMSPYIARRVAGAPRILTPGEMTSLVEWVGGLTDVNDLRVASAYLLSAKVGLASASGDWGGIGVSNETMKSAPDEWAHLFAGLLARTVEPGSPGLGHWLDKAMLVLEDAGADRGAMRVLGRERYRLFGR